MRSAYLVLWITGVLWTPLAQADWPPGEDADMSDPANWPNDPGYDGQWNLWSFIPEEMLDTIRADEIEMGSGVHADRAWQRTIGDPRVVIAVLDSGIRWRDEDLLTKHYLNAAELPAPDVACRTEAFLDDDPDDANGDGVFNMRDWALPSDDGLPRESCDPSVPDANENGFIDPQDLIVAFSDDVDDDMNGYTDDISGWDFFHNDNDPADDTEFGHGTGEANDSAAEANNGRGDAGVCPLCRTLMVRAGDSFVVDVNDWAMAVFFAVDSGASVIQEALGSINNSTLSQQAMSYAYENDAIIIASAADEDSFHHNMPGTNNHMVYVHAITHDVSQWEESTTFLAFNNCSNYGGQLVLSTPGAGCSSEATGKTSGIAGLIYSAALLGDLPFPHDGSPLETDRLGARRLTAEEAKQILIATVDDINVEGSEDNSAIYPSQPGWDQRFGYGRPNARSAVDEILHGRIPPEVDVDAPKWFEVIDPSQTPLLDINGHVSFRSDLYESLDYVVEVALGIEPNDDPEGGDWTVLAQETVTEALSGTLATWDLSKVDVDNKDMVEPDVAVNRYLVTVRIRAVAHSKSLGDVAGVMRKTFHIHHDDDSLPGFPVDVGASGEAPVKMADLDGDGADEIVMADTDGWVHAFRADGSESTGWPVFTNRLPGLEHHEDARPFATGAANADAGSLIIGSPAIGDLDGDGTLEVVAATYDGFVYAFEPDGAVRDGFPVEVDRALSSETGPDRKIDGGFFGCPVMVDLDGDSKLEIIAGAMDAHLYAWREDGSAQPGFPVLLQVPGSDLTSRSISSPAVGDVDGDGSPEITLGTNEEIDKLYGPLYLVRALGNKAPGGAFVDGWPQLLLSLHVLPLVGEGLPNTSAMADVDGDGDDEVIAAGIVDQPHLYWDPAADPANRLDLVTTPFGPGASSDDSPALTLVTNGAFGDLDANGHVDYVHPTGGFGAASAFAGSGMRTDFDHSVTAWHLVDTGELPAGRMFNAWPRRTDDWQFFMSPIIADIDGDDLPEAIVGSAGYYLHAWNHAGVEPTGWPKFTGQWIISAAALGDVDGDGSLDVAVATRSGFLYAWTTTANAETTCVDWASVRHDNQNTGNYGTPLSNPRCGAGKNQPDGGVDGTDGAPGNGEGCNCAVSAYPAPSPWAWLGLLVAVALGRRRIR